MMHADRPLAAVLTPWLALTALLSGCGDPLSGRDMEWVSIPAGSFMMGCVEDDPVCEGLGGGFLEAPRHMVNVPAFEMTRTEITQYQYWKVTGDQPSHHPACGDCPVENMPNHYHDARAFCQAVGGRLPSEAQWEYAARAGTTTIYQCGNHVSCLDDIAWHGYNSMSQNGERHPHPAALKQPNAFGLYDMTGNVQEWTEDCSHDDYTGAPTDGSAWMETGGGDCTRHVFKDCTYNTEIPVDDGTDWMCRPSGRYWDCEDIRGIADGFRCVRDVSLVR